MTAEQLTILTNIIGGVESGGQRYGSRRYDAYAAAYTNSAKEYTCTLGWAQNYGSEAQKLVQMIFDKDKTTFRKVDTANIEGKLKVDWVGTKWNPTASQKKALIAIITTDIGKQCQDDLFKELMNKYIAKAIAFGVNTVRTQMMFCEIAHLGGTTTKKDGTPAPVFRVFAKASKPWTVDTIYEALLKDQTDYSSDNQVGDKKYQSRHECCVRWIKQHVPEETTSNPQPVPQTPITAPGYSAVVKSWQAWANATFPNTIRTYTGKLLDVDGYVGEHTKKVFVTLWKYEMNKVYGTKLTLGNFNFGSSCKALANKSLVMNGSHSRFVTILEGLLAARNYYSGEIDQDAGKGVVGGIKQFQRDNGLEADGECGANTWYKIFN